jgi:hypothetical protein
MIYSTLSTGQFLGVNDVLQSPNGVFKVVMQSDGNLVLLQNGTFIWGTTQHGGNPQGNVPYIALMQSDGNLCVYAASNPSEAPSSVFVWGSIQEGHLTPKTGLYVATVQDDSNFVINQVTQTSFFWGTGIQGK